MTMTKTKNNKKTGERVLGNTAGVCVPTSEAKASFVQSVRKLERDDGTNSYTEAFLEIARSIESNQNSYCLDDWLRANRAIAIPFPEFIKLFHGYTGHMIAKGKLVSQESVYDGGPLYVIQ